TLFRSTVGEPFAMGPALSLSLSEFAYDLECVLIQDTIVQVRPQLHEVVLGSGEEVGYDKLIVALGAERVPAFAHAATFRGQEDRSEEHGLVEAVELGYTKSVAFVVPPGVSW